ncbi:MAG: tetratricopeptide repeat protein [Deltaproteobacteria bacterium]|nr:tetratricopeptide repeat protein [Deltaproteobacteria bacterium]
MVFACFGIIQCEVLADIRLVVRMAMAINSNYAMAHNSLGAALMTRGRVKEAITHFSRAVQVNPDYDDARKNLRIALQQTDGSGDRAKAHNSRAIALAGEGKLDEAVAHLAEALRCRPEFAEAHYNMGNALAGLAKLDEAIVHYLEAVRIRPDYAEAHNNLGIALAQHGKPKEAMNHFFQALQIRPSFSEARNNLIRLQKTAPSP